jgi:hypothetical protein
MAVKLWYVRVTVLLARNIVFMLLALISVTGSVKPRAYFGRKDYVS